MHNTALDRPFHSETHTHQAGTTGIVIPFGRRDFRMACRLIATIRRVHLSTLLIQLAYAGDFDLPLDYRHFMAESFADVELLDMTTVFNDTTLQLATGKYEIKPFAVLASRFQKVIIADSDAVFVQDPSVPLHLPAFEKTDAYLFHDRSLWLDHDRFHDIWWQEQFRQIGVMSDNILKSRAYLEGFSEHAESGVVVLDKSQLPVLMALLHTCWQNSAKVRYTVTYVQGSGDNESWWLGLEALGVPYAMEDDYAVALVQQSVDALVSTNYIAHVDSRGHLLWWNGGLLKSKKSWD